LVRIQASKDLINQRQNRKRGEWG